jgi:hypothetical protein
VGFRVSNEYSPEDGINWGLNIYYDEGNPKVDNSGRELDYGEVVINEVKGQLPSPPFPPGYTLGFTAGTRIGPRSVSFENILRIDNAYVFMSK